MNARICAKCPCKCHLAKLEGNEWRFIKESWDIRALHASGDSIFMMNPLQWMSHQRGAKDWKYVGGSEAYHLISAIVPDDVMKNFSIPHDCERYAEQLIDELNGEPTQ